MAEHRAKVEALPFRGLTVLLPTLSDHTFSNQRYDVAAYRAALAPMPTLRRLTHNFLLVRLVDDDLDLTDDTQWKNIVANLGALGTAARDASGFDGIFFDTEYYGNGTGPWRTVDQSSLMQDTAATRQLYSSRGQDLARTLGATWPDAVLLSTYGPWLGVDATAEDGFTGLSYVNVAFANRLLTPFLLGFIQGSVGSRLRYVDGGELYGLRTGSDFERAYQWMKTGLADSAVVRDQTPGLTPRWPEAVGVAFGVYDSEVKSGKFAPLATDELATAIAAALDRTDRYVWTYSDRYDWVGGGPDATPPPPPALADALHQVVRVSGAAQPS